MGDDEARSEPGGLNGPPGSDAGSLGDETAAIPPEEAALWAELVLAASKVDEVSDPAIRAALEEAIELKAEKHRPRLTAMPESAAAYSQIRALFSGLPVVPDAADAQEPTQEDVPVREATAADLEEAENLIRQARVATMRGDRVQAGSLLEQAARLAPGSATVQEALGDEMSEQKRYKQALDHYDKAKKAAPGNVSLEKKHADAAYHVFAAGQVYMSPISAAETAASAKAAVVLSLLFPGLGQIVSGRVVTGIVQMAGWLASWVALYLVGFENLTIGVGLQKARPGQEANMLAFVFLATAVLFHLAAIFDAASRVDSLGRVKRPERPVPPADLPFE